jgi:hypothetical protein
MNNSHIKTSVVITSINPLNEVIKQLSAGCKKSKWDFIIAGDTISHDIDFEGITFLDVKKQLDSGFSYAKKAPFRNYCRKNIAYLHAIKNGSTRIIETDDDNFPKESFFHPFDKNVSAKKIIQKGWVNAYRYFTENENIWPRGFSLSDVRREIDKYEDLNDETLYCPVQNGLVDNDPDIDALYRILFTIPFNFEHKNRKISYGKGSWCSFNTQNTVFYKEVFPLMYQPATPQFREADILRSLVIQRILWENNANILFYSPTVWQERNLHDLMDDLKQETKLYAYIKDASKDLEKINIKSGEQFFQENMIKCYEIYLKYGFITNLEFQLIDSWFNDLYV